MNEKKPTTQYLVILPLFSILNGTVKRSKLFITAFFQAAKLSSRSRHSNLN